jgi:hypothetical protein
MASLLGNLKTIAPCLGFRLVYPILTMMFAGTHRTFLGLGVSRVEADFLFGRGYMLYPTDIFFAASVMAGAWVLTGFARNLLGTVALGPTIEYRHKRPT